MYQTRRLLKVAFDDGYCLLWQFAALLLDLFFAVAVFLVVWALSFFVDSVYLRGLGAPSLLFIPALIVVFSFWGWVFGSRRPSSWRGRSLFKAGEMELGFCCYAALYVFVCRAIWRA